MSQIGFYTASLSFLEGKFRFSWFFPPAPGPDQVNSYSDPEGTRCSIVHKMKLLRSMAT